MNALGLAISVLGGVLALPHEDPSTDSTLKGLPGVWLVVETNIVSEGISIQSLIRSLAELHLRRAGIRLFDIDSFSRADGSPKLRIELDGSSQSVAGAQLYLVVADIKLFQLVRILRDSQPAAYVPTWSARRILVAGEQVAGKSTRELVPELVGKFIDAYHSQNKPASRDGHLK